MTLFIALCLAVDTVLLSVAVRRLQRERDAAITLRDDGGRAA